MASPRGVIPADILPHRPPMLLVDALLAGGERGGLGTSWTVPDDCPWVRDGVLDRAAIIEAAAQAAAARAGLDRRERGLRPEPGYLGGIDGFEIEGDVRAGEVLHSRIEFRFRVGNVVRATCVVRRGTETGELVARGELSLASNPASAVPAGATPPGSDG